MHKAYRYTTRAIGIKASYDDLARVMTQKLNYLLPGAVDADKISLKPHNVREFFNHAKSNLQMIQSGQLPWIILPHLSV